MDLAVRIKYRKKGHDCIVPDFRWSFREDGPRDPGEMLYSGGIVDFSVMKSL